MMCTYYATSIQILHTCVYSSLLRYTPTHMPSATRLRHIRVLLHCRSIVLGHFQYVSRPIDSSKYAFRIIQCGRIPQFAFCLDLSPYRRASVSVIHRVQTFSASILSLSRNYCNMDPQYVRLTMCTNVTIMHLFHSDTPAANYLERFGFSVRRYVHRVRSTRAATWICHDVQTRISANDRFVADRVRSTPLHANHFHNYMHSREPHEITDVILAFGPLNNIDHLRYLSVRTQLCSALRHTILRSLDAPALLSAAVTRDAWLWEGECALVAALRTRAGLGISDASGWLYPSSKASLGALSLHTESTL